MFTKKKIAFKGINFFDLNYNDIKNKLKRGGLLVLPSGPGLSSIERDKPYYEALKNSDIALFDSGYFCLLLKFLKFITVKKFSGYKFLKTFFNDKKIINEKIFFVDPTKKDSLKNKKYLVSLKIKGSYHYIAPIYKRTNIVDPKLLKILKKKRPKFIIINLGGNVQEVLGYYIKRNIKFRTIIICSGAAIAYFTKQQAPVNDFFDRIYLGWLFRIIFNPVAFFPRYSKAITLFFIVLKNRVNES